ncbi:MAG: hypothetical protein IJM85_01675 [Clostridia bacterium]|nr:hypothetical protein [Clostridia bacterium]
MPAPRRVRALQRKAPFQHIFFVLSAPPASENGCAAVFARRRCPAAAEKAFLPIEKQAFKTVFAPLRRLFQFFLRIDKKGIAFNEE